MADQYDSITVLGFIHVVNGDENRDPLMGEVVDQRPEAPSRNRIDAGGRLVQKKNFRALVRALVRASRYFHPAERLPTSSPVRPWSPASSIAHSIRSARSSPRSESIPA